MSKANVLHVIDTLNVGGAEKLLVGIVNGLPQFNHHVIFLCGSNTLGKDLPDTCQVTKLDFRTKWDTPSCVIRLRRYIKKNKIDVVHSHLVMSTVMTRLACPKNVQLFNTIHSMLGSRCFAPGKRMQRFIERLCYRKRHHIITVSENVYHDYNECIGIKGKHTVLPNFVEDKFFTADYKRMSFNGTFRMVTVGNLKPAKNYPFLIEAFKKLPKGIHLDIYGDGPLKNELQSAIEKHKLNIRLCGPHENVQQVLTQYDMFVMSSIVEGQPVALLEAMASGMPAALSDIPALREAAGNKAIFYDLNNINEFVDKITAIANHEVDLDEYAKANFERIKNMASKKNYMHMLSALYTSTQLEEISFAKKTVPGVSILMPGHLQANTHVAG